jgi:hypothetical protein
MSLASQLSNELRQLAGYSAADPRTIVASQPGIELALEVLAADSLSCSFRELRIEAPALGRADVEGLRRWANAFCQRVTYLLEHMAPLEVDVPNQQVLVRSAPPERRDDLTSFYEIVLQSHAKGHFSLRRFRSQRGSGVREQVAMHLTHEVLSKLIDDLEESISQVA